MEWISVNDRLPDEEQIVIAYGPEGMLIGRIYAQNFDPGYDCYSEHEESYNITHWTTLPNPPTI